MAPMPSGTRVLGCDGLGGEGGVYGIAAPQVVPRVVNPLTLMGLEGRRGAGDAQVPRLPHVNKGEGARTFWVFQYPM